ncbi:MAG: beta galactosidase jelly roll domain-containing protein [Chitinispirillaceae bacterium]|nr:beta galactosidase jelly roll domain-containing protein [Chitinispirillaceae bacterium]
MVYKTKWYALSALIFLCLAFPARSVVYDPPMPDPLARKADMSKNWRFYRGALTGAQAPNFNDSGTGWSKICVPHSCSYDSAPVVVTGAANWVSEWSYYKGDCWYRKTFGVPLSAKKLFIEFEGAMQVATVYVNGTQVGLHNNSGYTAFYYDITGQIIRGANNVVAVRLNNAINNDIPPGTTYTNQTSGRPDFLLYSGLYRPVWLHAKDSVYIPIYRQHIRTINVSASSAQVRALTPVKNDATGTKAVSVTVTVFNAGQANVSTLTESRSLGAGVLDTFDMALPAISGPSLWSPSNPYIYSVQTLVRVGGVVVDSVVEPCGIRWITWNTGSSGSFNLNGSRLEIRGACTHQTQGWMENAVPDTRFWQELKLMKDMGCNSVRSAHYPRSQAFYSMCDKIGMLVYVEIPSWGWGYTPSTTCWARIDSCVKEMIHAARNHPSIYLWGLYNEPIVNGDFRTQVTSLNNTAHALDPTRFTAMANIKDFNQAATVPDVQGLNYTETGTSGSYRWLNTESRPVSYSFYTHSYRGSALDLDTTYVDHNDGSNYDLWLTMQYTLNTSGQLSGGHFWCLKDYNTPCNLEGSEGILDRFTVPKNLFYMFRYFWTGRAPEYPRSGTATQIDLVADTTGPLRADSANVFLITATLRDGSNRQIRTATGNVTFTVSPSNAAIFFGGNVVHAYAGRAGAFLRTTTTPATITVTAAYSGLSNRQITLTTIRDTNWVPPYTPSAVRTAALLSADLYRLRVTSTVRGLLVRCPPAAGKLTIVNCLGRTVYSREVAQGEQVLVNRRGLGSGLLHAVWEGSGRRVSSRVSML